jgi:hypothetical protein
MKFQLKPTSLEDHIDIELDVSCDCDCEGRNSPVSMCYDLCHEAKFGTYFFFLRVGKYFNSPVLKIMHRN